MEEVKEIQEVKELTDEQKEQSRQLKAYIESYKKLILLGGELM